MADPTPNWQSLSIQIPGKDLLESVRNILETLMIFLELLKTILETVKAFLIDFGNPLKALIEALIQLILQLFEALKRTGVYAWFDIPDPLTDPNFDRHFGGYQAFTTRFKASLVDNKDSNRPQPISGVTKSGFILIVVDAEGPAGLVKLVKALLQFFGREFKNPTYAAPANFKVLPVGTNGDPILSVVKVFQQQPKSLVVEWALPPASRSGDPGFSAIVPAFSNSFVPPKFLIEKSATNVNVDIDAGSLNDASAAGRVTTVIPTVFEKRGEPGVTIKRTVRLDDEYGDPFIKFQKYIVVDTSSNTETFLLGQLGTFRYIDNDVQQDKTYQYRVRAFSGSLAVGADNTVSFQPPTQNVIDRVQVLRWPASDTTDPPIMGKSSAVISARVPTFPAKFDVIENLKRVFQCGFSLNYHLPPTKGDTFDSTGRNTGTTPTSEIGLGSLKDQAGPLVAFKAVPLSNTGAVTAAFQPNVVTGSLPLMPWQTDEVQANSTKLATIVAGGFLQSGNAEGFRALMQGPLPKGPPTLSTTLAAQATTLEQLVFAITSVQDPTTVAVSTAQDAAVLYSAIFADPNVRLNILQAVNFCKTFTLGGAPPDWTQVSILRDIIPWSGQMMYELLAKIQALSDAFRGVVDEIKAFIGLIERKINTIEQFIQYLISILDFIESLSLGFFFLSVPETSGDAGTWASLIDQAGGTPPPSGPGGYTGGIGLAYVAVDVGPFVAAFQLIF